MKVYELKPKDKIKLMYSNLILTFIKCDGAYGQFKTEEGELTFIPCHQDVKLYNEKKGKDNG